jgi:DNA-directed RNA polymerase subunit alpha
MGALIPAEKEPEFVPEERFDKDRERLRELLARDIDELEISNRASNCLKKGRSKRTHERISINTIGDLVQRTEKEMLDIENFGRKSLEELKKVLEGLGLTFGMDVTGLIVEKD